MRLNGTKSERDQVKNLFISSAWLKRHASNSEHTHTYIHTVCIWLRNTLNVCMARFRSPVPIVHGIHSFSDHVSLSLSHTMSLSLTISFSLFPLPLREEVFDRCEAQFSKSELLMKVDDTPTLFVTNTRRGEAIDRERKWKRERERSKSNFRQIYFEKQSGEKKNRKLSKGFRFMTNEDTSSFEFRFLFNIFSYFFLLLGSSLYDVLIFAHLILI